MLEQVDSLRGFHHTPSYQIFYEFEEDVANYLKIPVFEFSSKRAKFFKAIYKLPFRQALPVNPFKKMSFFVMMNPDFHRFYLYKKKTIPYIIDYWAKYGIEKFNKDFKAFPWIYIYSWDSMEYLQNNGCTLPLKHLQLSISDRWYHQYFDKKIEKDIDIIQIGRKNHLLEKFIFEFIEKYPQYNYVHRKLIDGKNIYYSTKEGVIGTLDTRADYFELLSRAKISIVSTPGLDGDQKTGGINPVTARVLESAACKCHMIGRFVENNEFHKFEIAKAVHNIQSYEEFEQYALKALQEGFNKTDIYRTLLLKNLNSVRAEQIKRDFK